MNKLFLVVCVLCFFVISMKAQNALSGNVQDESNKGISSATVRILSTDSVFVQGTITDENGIFSFKELKKSRYILAFSCIGYEGQYLDLEMPNGDYRTKTITLKNDNIMLDGVEVTGSSFIKKRDRLLVIPDKEQLKHAYSGYDLLYNLMIPGVSVNRRDGAVSTSRGAATLYINGVKVDFHEVQNLRPKDIEKVEYFDRPTGDYLGDQASINYITKVYKTGGYVALDGEQNIGYLAGKYNVGAKFIHGNTSYTFFGGYNMREYDGVAKEKNEDILFPDYSINRNSLSEDAKYSNNQQYAQFKVSNNNEKRSIFGLVSLVRDATPHDDKNEFLTYSGYKNQTVQSLEEINQHGLKPSVKLDGIFHPTENQRIHVMVNGSYSKNIYDRNYTENKQLFTTNADEDLYSFSAVGIYGIQLKHKNSFGGNIQHYHNITSSSYSGDNNSWQHLWMGETIAFLNYTQDFGEKFTLTLSPGGSLLNYKLHGDNLRQFWSFRTNSWVSYRFNSKHSVDAGFAMGNGQAHLNSLSSVEQKIDFIQVKRGNPNLDNLKVYDYFFTYHAQIKPITMLFNFWYTVNSNNISSDYYIEKDKLISSYRSDLSYHKLKAELLTTYRISTNIRANVNLRYEHMNVPQETNFSADNFTGSADVNYFLKSFTINAYVKLPEKILDDSSLAILKTYTTYGLSVRYNKRNWMAEVGTDNPFTRRSYYREYSDYGVYRYNQVLSSRTYQQTGYVKIAYTFDFGKKTSREYNNVDKSINSGILKAR